MLSLQTIQECIIMCKEHNSQWLGSDIDDYARGKDKAYQIILDLIEDSVIEEKRNGLQSNK